MVRPPEISDDAKANLHKFRAELAHRTGEDITIGEALDALLAHGVTDSGELPSDAMRRICSEISKEEFPT